ncbi:acetyl-CoA carboxylase biotin carboxylase subunit family protein [Streptomyces sp. NPDC017940]|uniref:acetyl-CoA carboxylase biotin carboxylase subunit family protein n=1 Tax=Streptomyces sp. NPDC017940 TaxID=3365017 RepID=UPI0037B15847
MVDPAETPTHLDPAASPAHPDRRLVLIDASVAAARTAHSLPYQTFFVQRPGAPVQDLVDDHSGYYTVDFAADGAADGAGDPVPQAFTDFVTRVLRPLAPMAVVGLSPAGQRAAAVANSLLGTAGVPAEDLERLTEPTPAPAPPSDPAVPAAPAAPAFLPGGTGTRTPKPGALFINHHSYAHFHRGGRHFLPMSELDVHLATRNQFHGGVRGLAQNPVAQVAMCDPEEEDRWRAVCEWTLRNRPVGRVIAVHERAVLLAAELRSKFGLPGMDFETATLFRDKLRMKEAVRASGAAVVPDFSALDSPADLLNVDWSTGRKVIKSRWGLAAKDLFMVDTLDEARDVVARLDLSGAHYGIEEFVTGRIYHCDSVVRDGEIRFSSVGRYLTDPAGYRPGGIFGTVLVREGELAKRITELSASVLSALGIKDGTTHLELFHTPADELIFCEVAGRPPGGIIPPVIEWQYGFNIVEAQIRLDAGLDVSLGTDPAAPGGGTCGFLAFYPGGGESRAIAPARLAELGVVEHIATKGAGNGRGGVRHSTDFLDSYVIKAPDDDALLRRIDDIQDEYRR